jgi:hypothetical protein
MSLEHDPSRQKGHAGAVSDPSYTPDGFCAVEQMSRSQLYKAWREGWGPEFYWNGNRRRITPEGRREWQRQRVAAAQSPKVEEQKSTGRTPSKQQNARAR